MILSPLREGFPITQGFWERPEFYKRFWMIWHDGQDLWCPTWTPLYSPIDWTVTVKDQGKKGYGLYIKVVEPDTLPERRQVLLAHLSKVIVKDWQKVKVWQHIWHTWNTWNSSWAHLHWSLRRLDSKGNVLNRENWYNGREDIFEKNWILAYTPSKY